MAKHGMPWTLTTRGGIYYCKLEGQDSRVSLCTRNPAEAKAKARILWEKSQVKSETLDLTLGEAIKPYFTDECPHAERVRTEGRTVSGGYLKSCRALLDAHVVPDKISKMKLEDLRRKDVLDFRARLVKKIGLKRTTEMVVARLKTILKELYFREEMDRDITGGIGTIKHDAKTRDRFTTAELRILFETSPGPWDSPLAYDLFLVAATTGMRRGELLALQWEDVNFHENLIYVRHALKDAGHGNHETIGLPKSGKVRTTPMVPQARAAILRQPNIGNFVFCHPDGEHLGVTFWGNGFNRAMKRAGLVRPGLTAHSFRHTINSIWRGAGIPDHTIRAVLGWTTEKVQDGYSHVSIEEMSKIPGI